jgi:DNA-directed RNA polymerase specialized sigma24 family protein
MFCKKAFSFAILGSMQMRKQGQTSGNSDDAEFEIVAAWAVGEIGSGNHWAFARLVQHRFYRNLLVSCILRSCNVRSFPHLEFEDFIQEISMKVFRGIRDHKYRPGVKFSTWVWCIAHNHCKDVFRKMKRECEHTVAWHPGVEEDSRLVVEPARFSNLMMVIARFLGKQSPSDAAVWKNYLEGFSFNHIQALVFKNVNGNGKNARKRLARIEDRIRSEFQRPLALDAMLRCLAESCPAPAGSGKACIQAKLPGAHRARVRQIPGE